ncbi:ABC transporter substrate-binding protein [Pseudonocardia lacus]|jgi:NitT/TauT family transport system substrate-binding protein|uniref:ABC transporter substrate-binding protein n=1 Tax=Pseudonocardia lacus TaxID=2835865 RepID=UPI001BDC8105|nr:ABC transporter substrate-binding protein [Pseudonocardia lacus]
MSVSPVRRPRGRFRSRLAAMGTAALLVAVAGCSALGGSDAPAEGEQGANGLEKTSIKFGILPIADSVAIARAQNAGYFTEEGLTVELVPFPSGLAATTPLLNGELDMAYNNWPTVLGTTAQGVGEFKIVYPGAAAGVNNFVMLVRPDSPVKTPQDLVGKKIAINTLKSVNEILVRSALQTNGVDANQVQLVDMAFPDMLPALQNNQVDAAVMVEPFITGASKAMGAVNLLDVASGPTADIPHSGGVTTAKFAEENPNTLAAVQRALTKAIADLSDRSIVEQTLPTYTKIDAPTAALISLPNYLTSLDATRLQRMADLMLQFEVLPAPVDVAPLLDRLPAAG